METILTILEIELKMSVINAHCHLMHRNTEMALGGFRLMIYI